jgi:hypothetical protein
MSEIGRREKPFRVSQGHLLFAKQIQCVDDTISQAKYAFANVKDCRNHPGTKPLAP